MTAWRQAVFVRQRRIDVIQRALSKVLDEESWSPATPRRLRIGSADASSRGWTMIAPELANFFLDRGGTDEPRLCRLARELRCPVYEVDVREDGDHTAYGLRRPSHSADPSPRILRSLRQEPDAPGSARSPLAMTLVEADERGRIRISGSPVPLVLGLAGRAYDPLERRSREDQDDQEREALVALEVASAVVAFGLVDMPDDVRDRIAALQREPPRALADYLGALAGFPGWTRHGDDAIAAGELIYEPPRIVIRGIMEPPPEIHEATARSTQRVVLPAHDRRGRRPRSASRPRR